MIYESNSSQAWSYAINFVATMQILLRPSEDFTIWFVPQFWGIRRGLSQNYIKEKIFINSKKINYYFIQFIIYFLIFINKKQG